MDKPRRVWVYQRGTYDGPILMRGDDEYGRITLCLRLPQGRAVVWAYKTCTDPDCEGGCVHFTRCPVTGMVHGDFVNERECCDDCGSTAPMPERLKELWA